MLKTIIKITKLNEKDILNVYPFGSRIYGNFNELSDYDFICVINNKLKKYNNKEIRNGIYNIHLITEENFINNLNNHKIIELECFYLSKEKILQEKRIFTFKLDLKKLKKEILLKSNNSWVKAKNKIEINYENSYIGIKSLFHSLRMLDFGIQIIKNNKIYNYSNMNEIYFQLKKEFLTNKDYSFYKNKYQNKYDKLKTDFESLTFKY